MLCGFGTSLFLMMAHFQGGVPPPRFIVLLATMLNSQSYEKEDFAQMKGVPDHTCAVEWQPTHAQLLQILECPDDS